MYRAMSEGKRVTTMGKLKSAVYARMEEMSFRSGAAVTGGALAAAGAAITLAVVLSGHSDAATRPSAPATQARLAGPAPSAAAPATSAGPSVTPRTSRSAAHRPATGSYPQVPSRHRSSATSRARATAPPSAYPTRWPKPPKFAPGDPRWVSPSPPG